MTCNTQWLHRYGGQCDWMNNSDVQSYSGSFSYWIVATYHLPLWGFVGVGLSAAGRYGGYKWAGHTTPPSALNANPWLTRGQTAEHKTFQVPYDHSSNDQVHFPQSSLTLLHFTNSTMQSHWAPHCYLILSHLSSSACVIPSLSKGFPSC